jgi:hypothetical protein
MSAAKDILAEQPRATALSSEEAAAVLGGLAATPAPTRTLIGHTYVDGVLFPNYVDDSQPTAPAAAQG